MTDTVEGAVLTARVLLDEVTRQWRGGRGAAADDILKLVETILGPHGLVHTYVADQNYFVINVRSVVGIPPYREVSPAMLDAMAHTRAS